MDKEVGVYKHNEGFSAIRISETFGYNLNGAREGYVKQTYSEKEQKLMTSYMWHTKKWIKSMESMYLQQSFGLWNRIEITSWWYKREKEWSWVNVTLGHWLG